MNRVMYDEWFPQIVYNHHQAGPAGTVMFAPPFRDPFSYDCDPLVRSGLDFVSAAMHNRFLAEGKPGVTMRSGAPYSGWWNGGLRTTAYFHNMIGILTETIGSPTPMKIPFVTARQMPRQDLPSPIEPQEWHLRQSIDYSITANYAILDYASRYRETVLENIWRMGSNAISKGRTDSWTPNPRRIDAARSQADLRKPEDRDARAYIVTSAQPDYATATKFINTLIDNGVTVHRSGGSFAFNGKDYPAGTYVVKCDQAFRPHILSMFEPQVHPDDFAYPGAPPSPPYDSAGWTLAYTMGVQFDRVVDAFEVPLDRVRGLAKPTVALDTARGAGFLIDGRVNDAFRAANRFLAGGTPVFRTTAPVGGLPAGAFWVGATDASRSMLADLARDNGVRASVAAKPDGAVELRTPRVALLDRYGGSMPSGWTRWVLEQFEFPFQVVYPPEVDKGALDGFDVLILVDGMTFGGAGGGRRGGGGGADEPAGLIPAEWQARQGSLTPVTSLPRVKAFLERGGVVVAIGSATNLAGQLGLPVKSALTEQVDGVDRPFPREKFFVPGSVMQVRVDSNHSAAWGMGDVADVMFDGSPAFRIEPGATGVKRLAWYDSAHALRSGWAWGQERLEGAAAAVEASVGAGRLLLYGPEILFRAQPHGTFKFLFNELAIKK